MQRTDFSYSLPQDLIAQHPHEQRSRSRLLCVEPGTGRLVDAMFRDLPALLNANDLLVMNDTKVIPARLHGRKATGGRVEVLVERITGRTRMLAHVRASKAPLPGTRLEMEQAFTLAVVDRQGDLFILETGEDGDVMTLLERYGSMPLPPYIRRDTESADRERYQTVYARRPGAVAAPTAGLHFDATVMEAIRQRGIEAVFVTLHVGAGTFQPVRVDNLDEHVMHQEWCEISPAVADRINATRVAGGRVVAVGTTVVRTLESLAEHGQVVAGRRETSIFIRPGFRFAIVDALLTNFHLPESTLLMLVSAFAGHALVMRAYRHAVSERYRFFSYGDAMFLSSRARET